MLLRSSLVRGALVRGALVRGALVRVALVRSSLVRGDFEGIAAMLSRGCVFMHWWVMYRVCLLYSACVSRRAAPEPGISDGNDREQNENQLNATHFFNGLLVRQQRADIAQVKIV